VKEVCLDRQAILEGQELQGSRDQQVLAVQGESLASVAKMELQGKMVHLDCLEHQVSKDLVVHLGHLEKEVLRVQLVLQDSLAARDLLVLEVLLDPSARLVKQGNLGFKDHKAQLVREVM
jgi:hypothetical protein